MKTVSNILLEARKKQGTDLATLSDKLKISIANLIAIESGDISKTPGDPYTLGFVKTYAEYFNLDTAPHWVKTFFYLFRHFFRCDF